MMEHVFGRGKVDKIKLIVIVITIILQSCTSDYTKNLGDGYFYRHEGKPLNDIYSEYPQKNGRIPANVVAFDYDREFIIAKQKPRLPQDILYEKEYEYKLGEDTIYFWLVIKKEKLVLGPLDIDEFELAKKQYNVPNNLKLK